MLVDEVFKHYNLRKTSTRVTVFNFFKNNNKILPAKIFEKHLAPTISRVSLYRVLKDLVRSGLIRSFYNTKGKLFYELSVTGDNLVQNVHQHFACSLCDSIFCLEDAQVIFDNLPPGFEVNRSKICLEGMCPNCQARLKLKRARQSIQRNLQ